MSGPKRNPDKLNTLGVIVIGICASVLVYVTIVALQAFYMKDTSEIQTMADYGGNDTAYRSQRTTAINNISEYARNADGSFRIHIDEAMKAVVRDAKTDPAGLVPGTRSEKASAEPIFGRSKPIAGAAPAGADAGSGAGSAAQPPADAGSGAQPPASMPNAPQTTPSVPMTPTGGQGPGGGPAPTTGTNPTPGTNPQSGTNPKPGTNPTPAGNTPPTQGTQQGSAAKGNAP